MSGWIGIARGVACCVLVCLFASAPVTAEFPEAQELLDGAVAAAAWLKTMEHKEAGGTGMSWPMSDQRSERRTGLDAGAAGIGTFYLRLYTATGEPSYLANAEAAGRFIETRYLDGDFFGPDWLSGAASGGTFALNLYEATGTEDYLDLARLAADQLIATATSVEGGYHWDHLPGTTKVYTGIPHGAAGIGLFFLDLYEHTGDAVHLEYAEGAYRWADRYSIMLASGAKGWKRLVTDTRIYILWSGSTGMIWFQERLYHATGNDYYLDELKRTADGLIELARTPVTVKKGLAWPYHPDTFSLPTPYFHGAASTIEALLIAWEALDDRSYRRAAFDGARWLMGIKLSDVEDAYYWPHILNWAQYDTGLGLGTASVGTAFVRLHGAKRKRVYRRHALGAARHLLDLAERPANGQMRWINYTNPADPDYAPREYQTGWSAGAAGIGIFLLDVRELVNKGGRRVADAR